MKKKQHDSAVSCWNKFVRARGGIPAQKKSAHSESTFGITRRLGMKAKGNKPVKCSVKSSLVRNDGEERCVELGTRSSDGLDHRIGLPCQIFLRQAGDFHGQRLLLCPLW